MAIALEAVTVKVSLTVTCALLAWMAPLTNGRIRHDNCAHNYS